MVKHTRTIRRLLFDHFVGLALNGLNAHQKGVINRRARERLGNQKRKLKKRKAVKKDIMIKKSLYNIAKKENLRKIEHQKLNRKLNIRKILTCS